MQSSHMTFFLIKIYFFVITRSVSYKRRQKSNAEILIESRNGFSFISLCVSLFPSRRNNLHDSKTIYKMFFSYVKILTHFTAT